MRQKALLTLMSISIAFGNSLGVTNGNDSGPGSLRAAIASAAPGDTIAFNIKTMHFPVTITPLTTLAITQSVNIAGPGTSMLFIHGGNVYNSPSLDSPIFSIAAGATVSLSGMTLQNGSAFGPVQENGGIRGGQGGSIRNLGNLALNNVAITSSYASLGGAIYSAGTLNITNSVLTNNTAEQGGAIFNGGPMTLNNTVVSGSTAHSAGAIFNGGPARINASVISGSSAQYGGGGIMNLGSRANLIISQSTVSGSVYGGLYSESPATIIDSTFSGNSTSAGGGAIFSIGPLTVSNSTFAGNSASVAGAIGSYLASTTLKNNIFSNNAGGNCAIQLGGSLGGNLSDDTSCTGLLNRSGDMNSTAAGLDPAGLQNNGGPTPTIALLPSSPAIDAVPAGSCTDAAGTPVTTDQRGVSRPQGRACDIGAFELARPTGGPVSMP